MRRHAHVDFQLFSQKSSDIPDNISVGLVRRRCRVTLWNWKPHTCSTLSDESLPSSPPPNAPPPSSPTPCPTLFFPGNIISVGLVRRRCRVTVKLKAPHMLHPVSGVSPLLTPPHPPPPPPLPLLQTHPLPRSIFPRKLYQCQVCLNTDRSDLFSLEWWPFQLTGHTTLTTKSLLWPCNTRRHCNTRDRYHGGRWPSGDDSFHSPSFHHQHSTNQVSWSVTIVDECAVTHHLVVRWRWLRFMILGFVKCRWWNDGWTVKTVVTWWSSASMIPAPGRVATGVPVVRSLKAGFSSLSLLFMKWAPYH